MPRYALKIEYHGKGFAGWQRQNGPLGVQEVVERALGRLEPDVGPIFAAGRTDAGVHAMGQVAHVDLAKCWAPFRLQEALNYHLKPHRVAIVAVAEVAPDFHARFDAVERRYLYRIVSRLAPLPHEGDLVWRLRHPLDVEAMRAGAQHLIGKHDFTTFRSSICQALSPLKTVDAITIEPLDYAHGAAYHLHVIARSFLHNQVRSFVGTLAQVGLGRWAPEDVRAALLACDRAACGPVAPPEGLYLMDVRYEAALFEMKAPDEGEGDAE